MKSRLEFKKLMKLDELEIKESYLNLIYWFFAHPTLGITLSDLASKLSLSKTKTRELVLGLVSQNFLIKEEIGRLWRISCNKDHIYNYTIKIPYNLWLIYSTNIVYEIRERIPNAKAIILFGSYRKGDDNENSDLDIAVEIAGNQDLSIEELGVIPQLGYRKNVKVNLHIFSRNRIDLNLFNNIANGIVLDGFLEVRT
mgnify:CR=1 FL=1